MSKAPVKRDRPNPDELHELATEDKSGPATQREPSKKHETLGTNESQPEEPRSESKRKGD